MAKRKHVRDLTAEDVKFTLTAEIEDDIPVRGNAMASGDDAEDKKVEDAIIARLDRGEVWAWACVEVRAEWTAPSGRTYAAVEYLGCCSYDNEAEFSREGGYLPQMKDAALAALNEEIRGMAEDVDAVRAR